MDQEKIAKLRNEALARADRLEELKACAGFQDVKEMFSNAIESLNSLEGIENFREVQARRDAIRKLKTIWSEISNAKAILHAQAMMQKKIVEGPEMFRVKK